MSTPAAAAIGSSGPAAKMLFSAGPRLQDLQPPHDDIEQPSCSCLERLSRQRFQQHGIDAAGKQPQDMSLAATSLRRPARSRPASAAMPLSLTSCHGMRAASARAASTTASVGLAVSVMTETLAESAQPASSRERFVAAATARVISGSSPSSAISTCKAAQVVPLGEVTFSRSVPAGYRCDT